MKDSQSGPTAARRAGTVALAAVQRAEVRARAELSQAEAAVLSSSALLAQNEEIREAVKFFVGTQVEEGFPHEGYINFLSNTSTPASGGRGPGPGRRRRAAAARLRFRAILMTAFSFILGVIPLVIASGAGARSRVSSGPRSSAECWPPRSSGSSSSRSSTT